MTTVTDAVLDMLAEGDRKDVARAADAAALAEESPTVLATLIAALFHEDPATVSHAAHALMTLAKDNVILLDPHREALARAYGLDQWEVKEQVAKILPRLSFRQSEQGRLMEEFDETLRHHESSIARTCALQAMVDMAALDPAHTEAALSALDYAIRKGSKALQARARQLAATLS
ncbi:MULTISPECIES: hypothetical protein [Kordiimonas]|jgi:hypothetical protein|uniref:hypothetical protein n=1 Tax=Kordiimonas TaxID=288021 RepID=UPI002580A2B6|nr:hypothetical protein [Kordiimonas sp. UBA4487]